MGLGADWHRRARSGGARLTAWNPAQRDLTARALIGYPLTLDGGPDSVAPAAMPLRVQIVGPSLEDGTGRNGIDGFHLGSICQPRMEFGFTIVQRCPPSLPP